MAVGPSEESIQTFIAFTSLPPENAIAWLQANNNEVEKAADAFYGSGSALMPPKVATVQWNETQFHADDSGDTQQSQVQNSFNINQEDTLNPNVFGAPSRPPSRVSVRQGRSAAQQYVETEDEEMNRALAMSLSESQTLPGQETGVTNNDGQTFGPAQQEYHDNKQWSMTVPGAHAQEILLSPEPFNRKRSPNMPAFLKPALDADGLSALITILHAIPLAREALLNIGLLVTDYGRDNQWWDGEPIKQLKVVNVDQGYRGIHHQDIVQETQRLMAFLDGTNRAYGSVEGLLRFHSRVAEREVSHFLDDWHKATRELSEGETLPTIFESRGVRRDPEEGEDKSIAFNCLNVRLSPGLIDNGLSLYDALDEVIWEENNDLEVFLSEIGNVVTFKVTCWSPSATRLGIDIPATWYPDRYLESSTSQARKYRERKAEILKERDNLESMKVKLRSFNSADASTLFAKTMAHLEQTSNYQLNGATNDQITEPVATESHVKPHKLLEQLRIIDERIGKKLDALERMKQDLVELARENALLYTQPTDDPKTCPTHEYTLRGVATIPSTCYVLEKANAGAGSNGIDLNDLEWQWWKLEYIDTESTPVEATKVSEQHVLTAARIESRAVVLVYADESAVNYDPKPLPSPLASFIRTDNLAFQAELDEFAQTTSDSPGKRKATTDDDDDLVTEHGRSPPFNRDQYRDQDVDDIPSSSQSTSLQREDGRREANSAPFTETSFLNPSNDADNNISPPFAPTPSFRTLEPKPSIQESSDNNIPISLRSTEPVRTSLDKHKAAAAAAAAAQEGQEMQERSSGSSFLRGRTHAREGYQLGSYEPEMDMEDDDDKAWDEEHA